MFETLPDITLPRLPDRVVSANAGLGACNELFAAAEALYGSATEAFFAGDDATGQWHLTLASYLNGLGHQYIDNEIHAVSPFD